MCRKARRFKEKWLLMGLHLNDLRHLATTMAKTGLWKVVDTGSKDKRKGRARNPASLPFIVAKLRRLHDRGLLNHFHNRLFACRAHDALDFFSVSEKNQRWNTFDSVTLCG